MARGYRPDRAERKELRGLNRSIIKDRLGDLRFVQSGIVGGELRSVIEHQGEPLPVKYVTQQAYHVGRCILLGTFADLWLYPSNLGGQPSRRFTINFGEGVMRWTNIQTTACAVVLNPANPGLVYPTPQEDWGRTGGTEQDCAFVLTAMRQIAGQTPGRSN